jgi:hypothetical protein
MSHRRAQPSQEAGQPKRHPCDLALPSQRNRLDSARDKLGPPGHSRQPLPVGERRELPQEGPDVCLVTRAAPPENVGIDDDQRLQAAASR